MKAREIRSLTGLSQVKFAERYHIPRRTVENWESRAEPPVYVAELLERAVREDFKQGNKKGGRP